MVSTARLVETLGGRSALKRRAVDDRAVIEQVRSGLPYAALEAIATRFEVSQDVLARILHLPRRTQARRKQERRLRPDESDRLARFGRIAVLCEDVLGSREKAVAWLRRSNTALGGVTPLERLDTDAGARQVERILLRVAHGSYS